MTRNEHLLVCLMEECSEVVQRISKALRFGPEEVQPGQSFDNADRIRHEFIDLLAAFEMLHEGAVIKSRTFTADGFARRLMDEKKAKVEKFLAFSAGRGLVDGVAADHSVRHPEAP